nr:SIMPL domain-containing protein [Aphanothece hegewaldii]
MLASCSILNLALINPAMSQEQQMLRTLLVTGQGSEMIPTTLTRVQLGVEIRGKTAIEVQQKIAKQSSSVVDFLRSRNVEQLQTTGIQLQPNYDYSNNQRQLLGYIGTNTVSFRIKTEQIGSLIDDAVKAGATRIDGVSFTATEEAIAEAQKEALRQATLDAQQQSDAVLKALNFTANQVVRISINGANVPVPRMIQADQLSSKSASFSTPVIGGEQTVQASVTLEISY